MSLRPAAIVAAVLAGALVCGPARSATPPLGPGDLPATTLAQAAAPGAPKLPATVPPAASPTAAVPQTFPITLQAGTGMLLQLPAPAATVMSAQPTIARVQPASPTTLFLMGAAPGRTTVLATGDNGGAIVQYDVTVVPGPGGPPALLGLGGPGGPPPAAEVDAETAARIRAAISQTVTGATGIKVTAVRHTVVLAGTVPTALAAQQAEAIAHAYIGGRAELIDELLVLGELQVNVRVRIAEIDRSVTRELGFNWQALGGIGSNWKLGLLTGGAAGAAISALAPIGTTPLGNLPAGQIGAGYSSSKWGLDGIIDALASDQLITILAEPNLTALSGETASFLAGGEFPVPIAGNPATNGGAITITVDFKQFGVSLAVVPTVLSEGRLNLRVRPEVSQLTSTGAVSVPLGNGSLTIPALTVRRAETTVELGSGQSFAIAGLLQKTSDDQTSAIPGIGETPVLGALFKSNSFQHGESELVIVVTPYIVKPSSNPRDLALPTDGFRPATDLDRILLGHQLARGSAQPLDAGFMLK